MSKIKVLDHGYVELLNIAGPERRPDQLYDADDTDPANVARISFGQKDSGRTREQDLRLAEYLMKNKHSSPWEFVQIWLQMKMPIFVARQMMRTRMCSINEISARYTTLPEEWYIPELENVNGKAVSNKQGRTALQHEQAELFRKDLGTCCQESYNMYLEYLAQGVAPELCRMFLHVNHYTELVWRQDLHNMMHMLSLRDHSHAQWEIQQYAKAIDTLIREQLPNSMELYDKYRRLE